MYLGFLARQIKYLFGYDYDRMTMQDCIENYKYKGKRVLVNDGKVVGVTE